MTAPDADPVMCVARSVSATMAGVGFAFVVDDRLEALADTLKAFFKTTGIPTHEARAAEYYRGLDYSD